MKIKRLQVKSLISHQPSQQQSRNTNQIVTFEPNEITAIPSSNKSSRISKLVKETTLSSTLHGIPNYIKAENSFFKFMWICGFLITVSTSIYLIAKNLSDYLEYETVTKINIIYEQPILFPTLSFQFNFGNFKGNYSLVSSLLQTKRDAVCFFCLNSIFKLLAFVFSIFSI